MGGLTRREYSQALAFASALSAEREPDGFVRRVVAELPALVGSELTTLSICDLEAGTRRVVSNPEGVLSAGEIAAFDHHIHQHPLVEFHTRHPRGGARRISDSHTLPAFRNLGLYQDYYRGIGINHVIAVPLIAEKNLVVSFVLNREHRDFGEHERQLLDALRPVLANLYLSAVSRQQAACMLARLREMAPRAGCTVVVLDYDGYIVGADDAAAAQFESVCPGSLIRVGGRLPDRIERWYEAQRVAMVDGAMPGVATPLSVEHGGRSVTLSVLPDESRNEFVLLLQGRRSGTHCEDAWNAFLTPREREVLTWVAAGKTNAEIAQILGMSHRTAQKHLERIYVKLGVETRTAAVARAFLKEGWCPPAR